MPGYCKVATCLNATGNPSIRLEQGITFHRFPKNPKLKKLWILRCGQKKITAESARVCSEHFLKEDYIDDMQNRLLGLPEKKWLKSTAVPSQNLPFYQAKKTNTARSERLKKRNILKDVIARLKTWDSETGQAETNDDPFHNTERNTLQNSQNDVKFIKPVIVDVKTIKIDEFTKDFNHKTGRKKLQSAQTSLQFLDIKREPSEEDIHNDVEYKKLVFQIKQEH